MRKYLRHLIGHGETARHRIETLAIVGVAALLMLIGTGQRILDSHGHLADADHLAALSLIMSGVPADALPVTFLDVDDATRRAWGATGTTPHAALAALARQSLDHGASAILVDFDVTAETAGAPGDPDFSALLRSYPADGPPLMLVRKIRFANGATMEDETQNPPSIAEATPYDADMAGKLNIRWVTTLNDIGGDRVVRKIRLWQSVCNGATGSAYPSAALVAAAYLAPGANRAAELDTFLKQRVAVECGHAKDAAADWPPAQDAAAQLPYVFSGSNGGPALFRIEANGRQTVAFRRIAAGQLVRYENGQARAAGEIDNDPFAGRVAILGASYGDSGDIHETPFGTMPGALVLANSIVQARNIVETGPASPFTKNVLAMLLFLLLAFVARTFIGAAAVVVLGIVTLVALFAVSRLFGFASGVDVIAVAVPGFALFKLIDSLIFIAMSIPKQGWRAVLKP